MDKEFDWLNPFASIDLGIGTWADGIKGWAISNRDLIQPLKQFFEGVIIRIEATLQAVPPVIMLILLTLIAWQAAGRRVAILVGCCLIALGLLHPNAWSLAMTTLAIVTASVLLCVLIGLPLGILAGKSDRFESIVRPVLDTMQTILAGLNQTIMLSLSMVVIASMISVKGLGNEVLRAMGRLDAGKAIVGGLGIVMLAIVLDRITQGLGRSGRERGHRHWWQSGPVGLITGLFARN
ncbi:MAG TPA: glycine/betaine ABC transporter permease [Gemmobacter sp.]|nr:glycine/betaine ABC transporter permease [Gemmobacter sp.]